MAIFKVSLTEKIQRASTVEVPVEAETEEQAWATACKMYLTGVVTPKVAPTFQGYEVEVEGKGIKRNVTARNLADVRPLLIESTKLPR